MKKIGFLLFILIAFVFRNVSAQSSVIIQDPESLSQIGKSVSLLEDKDGTLTLGQLSLPEYSSQFRLSTEDVPNLGMTHSWYWLRFKIINTCREPVYLEIANCNLKHIEVFSIDEKGQVSFIHSGSI